MGFTSLSCILVGSRKPHAYRTYYSLISVGNISFRVAVDTASSDIWIVSSDCTTAQCKPLPKYPLTYASPSFVAVNNNATLFNESFVDTTCVCRCLRFVTCGSILNFLLDASGFVAEEAISLGRFTMPQQAFGSRYFILRRHFISELSHRPDELHKPNIC